MAFTVRVVDDDDDGVEGVRVVLGFAFGQSGAEYTDGEGCAEFDGYEEGHVTVFLDGSDYGSFRYEDGGEITVTK